MGDESPSRQPPVSPYGDFDPKAFPQASYASLPEYVCQTPTRDGTPISSDQNPDSWKAMPDQADPVEPPRSSTKRTIAVLRWFQFALRVVTLMTALGVLVCTLLIRGVGDTEGWVIRIPPACDALLCVYACIHLLQGPAYRTATSAASYHFFALFVDAALIPFYVFISMFAENNYAQVINSPGRWRSFLSSGTATDDLLISTWIIAITIGGFHLVSIAFDIALIVVFRKIACLPAGMNPFEEDEDADEKPIMGHMHKTSDPPEMTGVTISEKRLSSMSGRTLHLTSPSRLSLAQNQLVPDANMHMMPSSGTRSPGSDPFFSPYALNEALNSRTSLVGRDGMYQQPDSERGSRADFSRQSSRPQSRAQSRSRSRPNSRPASMHQSQNNSYIGTVHEPLPEMPELGRTSVSVMSANNSNINSRVGSPAPLSGVQAQKQPLLHENWRATEESSSDSTGAPRRVPAIPDRNPGRWSEEGVQAAAVALLSASKPATAPRPAGPAGYLADEEDVAETQDAVDIGRALTMGSSIRSDACSASSKTTASSKTVSRTASTVVATRNRYYGALNAAAASKAAATVSVQDVEQDVRVRDFGQDVKVQDFGQEVTKTERRQDRAVSTGMNVMYLPDDEPKRKGRKSREVSGKVAEEGRGGGGGGAGGGWFIRKREVSGVA